MCEDKTNTGSRWEFIDGGTGREKNKTKEDGTENQSILRKTACEEKERKRTERKKTHRF